MNRTALLSFFVVLIFVVVFFKPVFLHPNETILTADGDGIKTYTMIAGHIRNDSSWTEYQNMNYPYGQTHVFTDGQTLITNTLKFLAIPFPWFETHSVGLSNMLWLLSFPLCAFFLSLVLLRLSLPKTLVIIAAVSITLLCPQLFRLQGHLTLSYAFCFPLSWWLLIKYDAGEKENNRCDSNSPEHLVVFYSSLFQRDSDCVYYLLCGNSFIIETKIFYEK
ncbi:MAG: hypothetical protein IPJ66_00185 [Bacteroidetes bacterium]|nr:hypothetical protein [Bacteroidota bacterium]